MNERDKKKLLELEERKVLALENIAGCLNVIYNNVTEVKVQFKKTKYARKNRFTNE